MQQNASEVLQDLGLTDMAKCLFKQPKYGNAEYIHGSSCIPLDAMSLAGASVSDVPMVLTKKYQKKVAKVTKLVDIMTSALAVFGMSISKELDNGRVDKQEFSMLQMFHLGVLNELANVHS